MFIEDKITAILFGELNNIRRTSINRRLSFEQDSALPGIPGDGSRNNPYEIEEDITESPSGNEQGQQNPEYAILYQRVHEEMSPYGANILPIINSFLNMCRRLNERIILLERILNWTDGETDEETIMSTDDEGDDRQQ